jgi:hypothetical protein
MPAARAGAGCSPLGRIKEAAVQIYQIKQVQVLPIVLCEAWTFFCDPRNLGRGQGVGVYRQTVSKHPTQGGARGRIEPSGEDPYPRSNADAP